MVNNKYKKIRQLYDEAVLAHSGDAVFLSFLMRKLIFAMNETQSLYVIYRVIFNLKKEMAWAKSKAREDNDELMESFFQSNIDILDKL